MTAQTATKDAPSSSPPPLPASHHPSRSMKLAGMNRNVMNLLTGSTSDSAVLPPIVPTYVVKVGGKVISSQKKCRKWEWASFKTSARSDDHEFHHWVKAGVEYLDYPYARFDIHLDPVTYTDDEYRKHLHDDTWTKSDTDKLIEMARIFELRWPVIFDRWLDHDTSRKIEDLQYRFYSVAAVLSQARITKQAASEVSALSSMPNADTSESIVLETAAARAIAAVEPNHQPFFSSIGTGTTNKIAFDLAKERERRACLEQMWNRTKEEEEEELALRKELKLIEAQLRKLKKSGGHILAASKISSRTVSPVPNNSNESVALIEKAFSSTAPTPMAQTPYLQSGRLASPATGGPYGINKATLKRMELVLEELQISHKPKVPTKRICDLYDSVRKDVLTLLTLQKLLLQKESQLQTKSLRFTKLGGGASGGSGRIDEEALLGITPVHVQAPLPVAKAKSKVTKPRANPVTSKPVASTKAPVIKVIKTEETKSPKKVAAPKKRKVKTQPVTTTTTTAAIPTTNEIPAAIPAPLTSQVSTEVQDEKIAAAKKRPRKA